jgi:uncharacterized membrane protein YeaQ/YmgE (transglycosylase-associated protein family)
VIGRVAGRTAGYVLDVATRNDRNGAHLQDTNRTHGALLAAGVISFLVLAGLFVTSLLRAPNPVYSVVVAVVGAAVALLVVRGFARRTR